MPSAGKAKCVRKFNNGGLVSQSEISNMNMLFWTKLPDGTKAAFATKGSPTGPVGYIQPVLKAITVALQDPSSKWSSLVTKCKITAILPIRDPSTGHAQVMRFANGTKSMNVSCIVSVDDKVSENTDLNGDKWCTMLVREMKEHFGIKIAFGGNSAHYGMNLHTSLDSQFLTEDVANLALMSYQESVADGSFFEDDDLIGQYFAFTTDVRGLFDDLFGV